MNKNTKLVHLVNSCLLCVQYELEAVSYKTLLPLYDYFVSMPLFSVALLDGVANTGVVELGDVQLAAYLAEKKPTGQPFFRNGECYIIEHLSKPQ